MAVDRNQASYLPWQRKEAILTVEDNFSQTNEVLEEECGN